ncbi:aspartate aminotransferase family protein [Rhodohalobacter mucosus]|uniref:Aspartate aminotransferase family protein n=1 Tax=Rhodohalobacter mucosus TaxID=2079485 RepID=A0A316TU49_9BACT|nr:aspartate aminotransferase family protein [Rhodohalobacter mucosus]PWN08077.1 aspartate aminotransferase family protein [Rhodohalobacter mucosus]
MKQDKDSFYRHIAQTSDEPMGLEVDRASGCYLFTTDGKKYVDLISGIAVSSLGHRHPNVIRAIKEQLDQHLHVMVYGEYIQKPQSRFADLLTRQLPDSLDRVYFVNSGTESVEGALKLAKKYTGRTKLVAFENSYHGDTHGSLSVTGRNVYRDPYEPLLPDVHFAAFNSKESLSIIDDSTAAVILEPIQGEGGVIPSQKAWLKEVRKRCDEHGALLIFDEIQTGFFRTGTLFAFEYYDVVPDILCLAKAMGGGMPLGAFVSSSEIFEVFKKDPPLNHVTTFGGHPVCCAAAHANLETLLSGDFSSKAYSIAEMACHMLWGDGIVEVRGRGAMLGLQLRDAVLTQKVVEECFKNGLILGWTLHSDSLIRIAPPLIIEPDLLEEAFDIILSAVRKFV